MRSMIAVALDACFFRMGEMSGRRNAVVLRQASDVPTLLASSWLRPPHGCPFQDTRDDSALTASRTVKVISPLRGRTSKPKLQLVTWAFSLVTD